MPNLFNSIKLTKPNKSGFDLSHDVKMSLKFGQLAPTMCIDTIPGDSIKISCDSLTRLAPLASPVFHRMDQRMEYWFVPNRLIWPNWERYISNNGNEPIGDPLPAFPTIEVEFDGSNYTPLMDYLGVPPPPVGADTNEIISALPFAAYQMIYNEYYRDQNLVEVVDYLLDDGDNTTRTGMTQLRNRAWEHDYFTSALPFAQKGAQVSIPVGVLGDLPVYRNTDPVGGDAGVNLTGAGVPSGVPSVMGVPNLPSQNVGIATDALYADNTTGGSATTIGDLRRATKLQEWLEKIARGGSRMTEVIRTFFGVKSSDQRLDRPEYIYGTKSPVIISEVLSTAETATNPQANMAGHGVSVINGNWGKYFCEEHGYIIGIMSVMPKTSYQQGLPKHFTKHHNPFEFFWPQFENIGEQAIENRELYAFTNAGSDTFGYIPRYAEYKFVSNRVAGAFRDTLDFWTMTRIFATDPALNDEFIELDPDSDNVNRIFAVIDPAVEKLYAHILHKVSCIRPMSKYGTPMF